MLHFNSLELYIDLMPMSSFPSKDKDKMDEFLRRFFSNHYYKKKKNTDYSPPIRYEEIEELKFKRKDFDKERLVDIFYYQYHTEIVMDLRDFKKKDINFILKDNILSVFDSTGKFYKEIKFRTNKKVKIVENSLHKGILRLKLMIKNT